MNNAISSTSKQKITRSEFMDIAYDHTLSDDEKLSKFKQIDLSGMDLSYLDLSGINLSNLDLSGVNFKNAVLDKANLTYSIISDAILIDTKMNDANLERTDFRYSNLSGAIMKDANLTGTYFLDANLQDAFCFGAIIHKTDFRGANLKGVDLDFSSLPLWCGGQFKTDEDLIKQISAHLLRIMELSEIDNDDNSLQSKLREYSEGWRRQCEFNIR